MNHLGTIDLKTKRLLLRKFFVDDAEKSYYNWTSDEKVTVYLRWQKHKSIEETKQLFTQWNDNYKANNYYQWAIILREDEYLGPIGTISVNRLDEHINMAHLGYCIGSQWWHKGITSEALHEIIRFLFKEVKVNRIESWHDPKNKYSGSVMKKCGMIYEGTLKEGDYNNTGIVDACVYAITSREFQSFNIYEEYFRE